MSIDSDFNVMGLQQQTQIVTIKKKKNQKKHPYPYRKKIQTVQIERMPDLCLSDPLLNHNISPLRKCSSNNMKKKNLCLPAYSTCSETSLQYFISFSNISGE